MLANIKRLIPQSAKIVIKKGIYLGRSRFCPVCESSVRYFKHFGLVSRPNARCPVCSALERHRLTWEFFKSHTDLFNASSKRMLHVAPEACFTMHLNALPSLTCLTADLSDSSVMVKMDLTNIPFASNTFDVICCNHVLEHVPDDRRALREFRRVLKAGGWAILGVPITAGKTFEDLTVTDPAERERLFGQDDHVRRYGPDYVQRLAEAGFAVQIYKAPDIVNTASMTYLGIREREKIFYCTER